MARHQVAAEFVGQPHDFTQAQRVEAEQGLCIRGRRLDPQLAAEFAAQFAPQFDEGAECIAGRLQQHAGEAALRAMRRQCAAEDHPVPARRGYLESRPGRPRRCSGRGAKRTRFSIDRLTGAGLATMSTRRVSGSALHAGTRWIGNSPSAHPAATLYGRFGRPSNSPGSSGGRENAVLSMTMSPWIVLSPLARRPARNSTSVPGSCTDRRRPAGSDRLRARRRLIAPRVDARVCQVKAGPSMSSAANVVTALMVEAGLRGVSGILAQRRRGRFRIDDRRNSRRRPAGAARHDCATGAGMAVPARGRTKAAPHSQSERRRPSSNASDVQR